jgi:hypothetical protein
VLVANRQSTMLGEVFQQVLRTLGLADRADQATELVARTLIEFAQTGERDPARLKLLTLKAFEQSD